MDRPPILDTRGRILRTALDLFAAHGYQRTPLRAIADRTGMTKAGVLYHFPSKEHLLVALAEPLVSDLEASLARAARLPWPAARWAALEGWLDTLLRHRRPLGTLYHDMTLLARGATYSRILRLAQTAYELVAGPDATRLERIRAVQATAMLGDPIVFFTDVPDDQLRAEMLDGVARLLGESPPDPPTGREWAARAVATPTDEDARRDDETGGAPTGAAEPFCPGRVEVGGIGAGGIGARQSGTARPEPGRRDAGRPDAGRPDLGQADAARTGVGSGRGGRRTPGRPRAMTAEQVRTARAMHAAGSHSVEEIAARLGVSRATVYRQLRAVGPESTRTNETTFDTD